jgi:cell division septal protein FtsQ
MILDHLFARNTRRKKDAVRGNYAFRSRRRRVRLDVHRLDMNPETPASIREKRRKVMRWGFKFAVASLVLTGIVSAGKIVVREAFMDSPRFKLQHLSVITDGSLQPSEIIGASGLHEGANMLGISLVQVREKLEQLPQVRHAKVSRGYPGVIFLEVEQRQPSAWLECPRLRLAAGDHESGCLLDADGFVLPSGQPAAALKNLPVIRVEKLSRLAPGQCLESTEVHAALKLLQAHAASDLAHSAAIRRIDASRGYALTVTFDTQLTAILPAEGITKQLQRLSRVIHEAEDQKWQLATVDLLVEKNVPVTLRASATPPSGTSAPAQRRPGRTLARAN